MSEVYRAARVYADRGWPVFPVKGKQPATRHGVKDATTDDAVLQQWFLDEANEGIGVAIATGTPSGLVVLDVDPDHGGSDSLSKLTEIHGLLPESPRVRTGGGGLHFYFALPAGLQLRNTAGTLGDGLDVRATGGYVVAPPSSTDKGKYRWEVTGKEVTPAIVPQWIIELNVKKPKLELARTEGSRNVALTSVAGTLRNLGLDESGIYAAISQMGSGLPDEEVRSIAQSVARYEPAGYPRTEAGQAELFASLNAGRFLYDDRLWLKWAGHWWDDHRVLPEVYAKAVEAARYRSTVDDEDERRFAGAMESKSHLDAVISLSSKTLAVDPATFDADPLKLGVENGLVDLSSGSLVGNTGPTAFISRHSGVSFVSGAPATRWVRFIEEIFNEDKELIDYIWKAVGYSFTGLTNEQCWFLCYGRGANGKSTFLETLRWVAGTYGHTAKVSTFVTQRNRSDADEDVASLRGKRFVISGEAGHTAELDQERIKALIGSETARARFLYSGSFEFTPVFKLWIANNQRPRVNDDSNGFWRRVRLIPFERQFSPTSEPGLRETLRQEAEGILGWAISGARRYLADGLAVPAKIRAVTAGYQDENDHLGQCIREAFIADPDGRIENHTAYSTYRRWALNAGYSQYKLWPPHAFARALASRFDKAIEEGKTYYRGITVKDEEPEENGVGY